MLSLARGTLLRPIRCALGILAWLFSKRKISLAEGFREGYILVDEGVEMEGATLKALSAISLISTLITGASPVLMSLLAYWVSYLWLTEQQLVAERSDNGPTPLQYGLLHQVLSAPSVVSLFNAVQYLFRNRSTRPTTPSYFPKAVLLGVLVFTVTQILGLADLWLHTTTTAVLFNLPSANFDTSPLMTSPSFNQSLCNEFDFPPEGGYGVCISSSDGWAQYSPDLIQVGQSVVSNSSLSRTVITLADAEDIAIAVPNPISKSVKFTPTSLGMRTRCESLNTRCEQANDTSPSNCNNIGISDIPTAVGVKNNLALYSGYTFTANETAAYLDFCDRNY
ncbi:hypothetical protein BDV93DRAFT_573953 [Ceratobasidium sp. AG-I]|nr:hypothetical protein BDV93DRAFT_573953 [Ceratobasidium sp. AG-I]